MTRIASRPPALPPQPPPPTRLIVEGQITGPAASPAAVNASPTGGSAANGTGGTGGTGAAEPSAFARMVGSLGQETTRGEAAMKTALSAHGSDLGAADLLALQAGVYRYGEVVDLASRLVDRATSNVKTVLQGSGG